VRLAAVLSCTVVSLNDVGLTPSQAAAKLVPGTPAVLQPDELDKLERDLGLGRPQPPPLPARTHHHHHHHPSRTIAAPPFAWTTGATGTAGSSAPQPTESESKPATNDQPWPAGEGEQKPLATAAAKPPPQEKAELKRVRYIYMGRPALMQWLRGWIEGWGTQGYCSLGGS
jgi:hypothetical protein